MSSQKLPLGDTSGTSLPGGVVHLFVAHAPITIPVPAIVLSSLHLEQVFAKIYKQFFPFGDPTTFANFIFDVFDKDGVRPSHVRIHVDLLRASTQTHIRAQTAQLHNNGFKIS